MLAKGREPERARPFQRLGFMATTRIRFAPVILAGGSGTRFWPRSRKARAKQILALDGKQTMIQQTLERLLRLADAGDVWVITNESLADAIAEQMPTVPRGQILRESAARNTAPACALAAFLIEKSAPDAVIGIFPSDHAVKNIDRFIEVIGAGAQLAASSGKIVVLGVPPTRAETGYGYIELGENISGGSVPVRRVKRFTEKPDKKTAEKFFASGQYVWNSGIFLWSAKTLIAAIREHQPEMATLLKKIAAAYGTADFEGVFAEVYPQCRNISVDYAVLEPRSSKGEQQSELYCLPGDFSWNDLGTWTALHEHLAGAAGAEANIVEGGETISIDARGNYVYAPGKTVALLGVEDLVVVETGDALLITTRSRSQDVGMVVRKLAESGGDKLI